LNLYAIAAIYRFEMARTFRTLVQSIISPVISTVLYFIVFGAAIGSGIQTIDGIHYSAFIVPGLIMLTVLMQSVANASFGIYFPKFLGTIYEHLSAPGLIFRDNNWLCRCRGNKIIHHWSDYTDNVIFVCSTKHLSSSLDDCTSYN
jgi:ABC-type multidrug transport system permease subunit